MLAQGFDWIGPVGSSEKADSSDRAENWSDFLTMALKCAIVDQISGKCFNRSSTAFETGVG